MRRSGRIGFGVVARGPIAIGVVAVGGVAIGVVAIGGIGIGVVALGAVALGGVALGAVAIGWKALGAVAVGATAALGPIRKILLGAGFSIVSARCAENAGAVEKGERASARERGIDLRSLGEEGHRRMSRSQRSVGSPDGRLSVRPTRSACATRRGTPGAESAGPRR